MEEEKKQVGAQAEAGEQAAPAQKGGAGKGRRQKGKGWRRILCSKKGIVILVLLLLLVLLVLRFLLGGRKQDGQAVEAKNIAQVQRGDITSELTSSGSLAAKDTYEITSLVSGEIVEADFEEGDQVTKDQVLYRIDPTDINQELSTAQKNVETAKGDLEDAEKDYSDAVRDYNSGIYTAKSAGYVKDLKLKAGDKIGGQNGTEIATLYNDDAMELRLPFLTEEADAIPIGANVVVTLSDTGEQIPGKVTEKAQLVETLTGGTMVKDVTVLVSNPGGLSTSDTAAAQYRDIRSAGDAAFTPYTEETLSCDLPDSVEVDEVLVNEGQYVAPGTALFSITGDTLSDVMRSYEKKVEQAESALSSAEDKLVQLQENLDEYTITAPISGQIIEKNSKVGDKLSAGGNNTTTMAIIYDLSELSFEMSIDEIDISKVAVGQQVEVTADAFENETFFGHVTNVSMNATNSNGVTTYPVTVTMDETVSGDGESELLPGMNVDGTIILEQAKDVLYIPSNALQRGDVVYVKDDSLTEDQQGKAGEKKPEAGQKADGSIGKTDEQKNGGESVSAEGPGGAAVRADLPEGFTAVPVETGLVTSDYVEIKSGLSEGQEVYVKDSASNMTNMFGMGFPGGGMGGYPGGGRGPGAGAGPR